MKLKVNNGNEIIYIVVVKSYNVPLSKNPISKSLIGVDLASVKLLSNNIILNIRKIIIDNTVNDNKNLRCFGKSFLKSIIYIGAIK